MKMHESITIERTLELIEESMFDVSCPGVCIACGEETDGVEPDVDDAECEVCGKNKVHGAEALLIIMA